MKASTFIALSVIGCSSQPAPPVTKWTPQSSATARAYADDESIFYTGPASSPCDAVQQAQKADKVVKLKTLQAAVALLCTACPAPPIPTPTPTPDAGTGGAIATGGRASTGGNQATAGTPGTSAAFAKCVAAKTADTSVQNVAKQSGQSVSSLVKTICSDPTILGGYN